MEGVFCSRVSRAYHELTVTFLKIRAMNSNSQALGINFATLTPEMLLHVGRAVQCAEQLVVAPVADAGAAEVSFGGAVVDEEGGPVEETFEWTDVLQGDWRLVSAG